MTTLFHIYRRPKRRWLQRVTGLHVIHHDRYSFGIKLPFSQWVYFPPHDYKDHSLVTPVNRTAPAHWKRCTPATYHDCTQTGRY